MNRLLNKFGVLFLFVVILSIACGTASQVAIQAPGVPETFAAETWSVMQTRAFRSITSTNTASSPTDTPTATNTSTITSTPTPTKTPVPPLTQPPTFTPQTPTDTPLPSLTPIPTYRYYPPGGGGGGGSGYTPGAGAPCLAARLVRDVTIPNGEILPPSLHFKKTWRIQNVGSCVWDTSVKMVFVSGKLMGGDDVRIPERVRPGKTVDVTVKLVSPSSDGTYTGNWKLKYLSEKFGDGKDPFVVKIQVDDDAHGTIYNFATQYCNATWKSSRIQYYLPCPGRIGSSVGFVIRDNDPHMENGSFDKPGLWTHPPLVDDGEIWGVFPALIIQTGDRFRAELGCLHDYEDCNVTFRLYYQIDGDSEKHSLGQWTQTYDGSVKDLDIDLSSLVNHYVAFILHVTGQGNHPKENAAFWYYPRIYRP